MRLYLRLLRYLKPYLSLLSVALVCNLIYAAANVLFMPLMRDLTNAVTSRNMHLITLFVSYISILYAVRMAIQLAQSYLMGYVSNRLIIDMRLDVYRHLHTLSLDYFKKMRLGDIISRVFSDIGVMHGVVLNNFNVIIPQTLTLVGVIGYLLFLNWRLTLLTLLILPLTIILINWFATRMKKIGGHVQRKSADVTHVFQEALAGVRVVQAFTREDYEVRRFARHNERNFFFNMKSVQISVMQGPILSLIQFAAITLVIWYGCYEIVSGGINTANMISFVIGVFMLIDPVLSLSGVYTATYQGFAAAERVFSILDTVPTIREKKLAKTIDHVEGRVIFENVSFSYEKDEGEILTDISIDVKPGEIIALVGHSGAGKTTFVNMVPRFYDPTAGRILLDGHDLRDLTINAVRDRIAIVPQDILLFSGSIKSNIAYGKLDASWTEIAEAAKKANAHEFIVNLKKGYLTKVGERGARLSGGQQQRIAIARALLRNPKILILDEATSALDTESERLVQDALSILMKERTTFVIAHRLSTILHADRIVVLENGRIQEIGRHDDLLQKNGLYAKLYAMQFKES